MRRINNLLYHVHADGSVLFFFFLKDVEKIETEMVNEGKRGKKRKEKENGIEQTKRNKLNEIEETL